MIREINMYAGINKMSNIHPMEKLLILLIPLLCCAYTEEYKVIMFNIIIVALLGFWSKTSGKMMRKFIYIAMLFAFGSIIPFIFEQRYGLIMLFLLRTINGALAISIFALTTPINHLVYLMSKNNYLSEIADIAKSLETFLIILEEDFVMTLKAMRSRGEGLRYIDKLKSISKACGVVLKNLLYRWKEINEGLKNRCYVGKYHYSYDFKINYKNYIFAITYLIINLIFIKLF